MPRSEDYEDLQLLTGTTLLSAGAPDVRFRLEHCLGAGGVGVVFLAIRLEPGTETPVVVKVLRPSVVAASGASALASVRKEAVALGRLNEHVPPTPFVVRLVDVGELDVVRPIRMRLPWLAIEYVHGGEEGTTLAERVRFACEQTGSAFDPSRAARALRCLASGLAAIHDVGIVHRDLSPGNVLCCGFGETEIFKISDFGLSRSAGMVETFGAVLLGTPGYAAPEQSFPDSTRVGPHTDVFSIACIAYFVLTGEPYFLATTIPQAFMLARASERRSVSAGRFLSPELRERRDVCDAIDRALAGATSYEAEHRPQHVQYLSSMLAPLLATAGSIRPSQRHVESVAARGVTFGGGGWTWTVRHAPGDERVIYSAAWDADGSCLAATTRGLEYWNGVRWVDAPVNHLGLAGRLRFVCRLDAGAWLVGGDDGSLAMYTFEGVQAVMRVGTGRLALVAASGRLDDILVTVAEREGGGIELWSMASGRWMKPVPVPQATSITTLSRIDDARWVVAGRGRTGTGFAALVDPLQWQLTPLLVPPARAYIASDGVPDTGTGIIAGAAGHVVHVERTRTSVSRLPDESDVSAISADLFGRQWAASLGQLWLSTRDTGGRWTRLFHDSSWRAPIIRLFADAGLLLALTADGGILEGRAAPGH